MQFHSSYKCSETSELNLFHGRTYIQQSVFVVFLLLFLGKHVIQTNPCKSDEDIYLCRLRLKQGREIQDFTF